MEQAATNHNIQLIKILEKVNELAVLPHVVFQVLELSGNDDTSIASLERAIIVDPGFSSRVLILANSAYSGLPKRVTSIKEAVNFLGFKAVRQLAMTVGVFDLFAGKTDNESLRRRAWWRHSVDSAVCCHYLAQKTGKLPPDEAYTCGLLHNIGRTLLDRCSEVDYAAVERLIKVGRTLEEAELTVYHCTSTQIAVAAIRKWKLPEQLASGVNYRHEPTPEDDFLIHRACTALGSVIADLAVNGISANGPQYSSAPLWALQILDIDPASVDELVAECAQKIRENSSAGHF
ncbi:MAG: HDOD domain-containing protein [Armatimonadetes bacterium]|nr:HDOD domain-containing protein [Armatimonadota bacterium]